MNRGRYSLLGLGHPRSRWFTDVAQWATSGVVSIDFSKCVSAAEVRLRLSGIQRFSAVVIEAGIQGVDRDLLDAARAAGTTPIIVQTTETQTDWIALGATVVLDAPLTPSSLIDTLVEHATLISQVTDFKTNDTVLTAPPSGVMIAITGPGGTGASTQAIALAQGLGGSTVLCDFARNSEQAMLHDATERAPSVEDLIDAHRMRQPSVDETRALTFSVDSRGYRILLGQRRAGAWSAMPPRAAEASIDGLRRAFDFVVADITADFEGEQEGGSLDVEERNVLARTVVTRADVVVVSGKAGVKGIHALARTIREVTSLGATIVIPLINKAPRRGLERASISKALRAIATNTNAPIFVPSINIEGALRDVTPMPKKLVAPVTSAVNAFLDSAEFTLPAFREPQAVDPGSLGLRNASGQ